MAGLPLVGAGFTSARCGVGVRLIGFSGMSTARCSVRVRSVNWSLRVQRAGGCGHAGASEPRSARRDPLDDVIVEAIRVQAGPELDSRRLRFEREVTSARPASAPDDVLRLRHVSKSFGALVALRDINVHLRQGEALGLVGDNASGKSTLLKIISSFHKPDAGQLVVRGTPVDLKGVNHARSLGIDCVYQD
jgi:ABC-type glutathione transport system ATPase component